MTRYCLLFLERTNISRSIIKQLLHYAAGESLSWSGFGRHLYAAYGPSSASDHTDISSSIMDRY